MKVAEYFGILKEAGVQFWNDKAPRLGAALAFYTALSISPLLLLVIGVAGLVFGQQAARGELLHQLHGLVGPEGAKAVEEMVAKSSEPSEGTLATVIGLVTLLVGATGVFAQLQDALNTVWHVEETAPQQAEQSWLGMVWGVVRDRFLSFSMVLGLGFLLLVSLVLNAALHAVQGYLLGPAEGVLMQVANHVFSFLLTFLLFALVFRFLPNATIAWSDVWIGGGLTAVLFVVGKVLIGLYLGNAAVGSAYGAAGSFVVLLLWIYYSTQILLYGAEFTEVYAKRLGSGLNAQVQGADRNEGRTLDRGPARPPVVPAH